MRLAALALGIVLAASPALAAGEDADLDLIPDAVMNAPASDQPDFVATRSGQFRWRAFLEAAPEADFPRSNLVVPLPPGFQPHWRNRLSADFRGEYRFDQSWSATIAERLNFLSNQGSDPQGRDIVNDLREAYVSWRGTGETFADAGRINLKSGVALGFNPTDYFRTNAVDIYVSSDPTVLRDNRLGTLMARTQVVREIGAVTLAAAPGLGYDPGAWWADARSIGLNLQNTNYRSRFLAKTTLNFDRDVTPEVLLYNEGGQTRIGLNATKGIGDAIVAYAEYSGGRDRPLAADALIEGVQYGRLPKNTVPLYPTSFDRRYMSQLAAGFAYALPPKLSLNIEYHYNQGGFSQAQFDRWLATGQALAPYASLGATGQLWWQRQFAVNQLEPFMRHQIFLRASLDNIFVPNLNISGVAFVSPYDGSFSWQVTTDYAVTPQVSVGALVGANVGGPKTVYGSLPQAGSIIGKLRVYF
jgi:hypothetical protein